jgi:hypothetical protein
LDFLFENKPSGNHGVDPVELGVLVSVGDVPDEVKRQLQSRLKKDGASRATSVGELHERLQKKLEELRGGTRSGTDVMIFKRFSPKNFCEKVAFFAQTTVKILIMTMVLDKNANFFTENGKNRRKLWP